MVLIVVRTTNPFFIYVLLENLYRCFVFMGLKNKDIRRVFLYLITGNNKDFDYNHYRVFCRGRSIVSYDTVM